jgi:hypothetical protein
MFSTVPREELLVIRLYNASITMFSLLQYPPGIEVGPGFPRTKADLHELTGAFH